MANILAPRSLGVALGAGTILLLCLATGAHSQQPTGQPEGVDKPAIFPETANVVRQLRDDLAARHAKMRQLQVQQDQMKAEMEKQLIEIQAAEKTLERLVKALAQLPAPAAPAAGRSIEQRLQQLEQEMQALLKEVKALRQAQQATANFSPLDFQALANHKRKDDFHSGKYPGNNLGLLASGEQRLLKIPFQIGEGVLQLGSTELQDKPAKITGIKVGKKLANLHFLHATAYYLEEEVPIGSYTVHFADGASETIPIVNGKDVTDWWKYPFSKPPTNGKVAWEGNNQAGKDFEATQWLFLTTWRNPRLDTAVTSIDLASTMDTRCAPFCVAITSEGP
jgi:hypothetical protein